MSNPAKPWKLSSEWTSRVMTEFFRQGDMEMDRGLAASPFMDRAKTNIAQCQVGFINILIKPFYEEWCAWLGGTSEQDCVENIVKNIAMWQDNGEEVLGEEESRGGLVHANLKPHLLQPRLPYNRTMVWWLPCSPRG